MAVLYSTITSASFFACAGFRFSSITVSSFSSFSQSLLSTLDSILGSTESSRAIASIITLLRREFRNPELVNGSDRVGVSDLLVGSVGFALLQRIGRKKTARIARENGCDEIIWDVVILDNGIRADVVGLQQGIQPPPQQDDMVDEKPAPKVPSFLSLADTVKPPDFSMVQRRAPDGSGGDDQMGALLPHASLPADRQHELSDEEIRRYILDQLAPGTRASIRTETVTSRTITVDVYDDEGSDIEPPPGAAVVAERFNHPSNFDDDSPANRLPTHTVIFTTASTHANNANLKRESVSCADDDMQGDPNDALLTVDSAPSDGAEMPPAKRSAPQTSSNNDPPGKRAASALHKSISLSSISSSEKGNSFGKNSLSKMAQRFRSNPEEKEKPNSRLPLRKRTQQPPPSSRGQAPKSGKDRPKPAGRVKPPLRISTPAKPATKDSAPVFSNIKQKRSDGPKPPTSARTPPARSTSTRTPPTRTPPVRTPPVRRPTSALSSSSKNGYFVHERSLESFVAHTDAYSRPSSPAASRHVRSTSALSRTRSEDTPTMRDVPPAARTAAPASHRMSGVSLYSVGENGSETSLVLAPRPSVYEDQGTLSHLTRHGSVPGLFPDNHLVRNIRRFCRFSSASYGANFLRMMGISDSLHPLSAQELADHHEHNSFSKHTGLPASTILLSSFVDPAGGSNSSGETVDGFPLVHYLSLDHESKAVVLTLRGTWGFEDILTDMTCDYDDLTWLGRRWQVHKGMHASARHLLAGGGGSVMVTIRAALEEFPDYGVVFCGHSLGGGVAALLATLISKPQEPGMPGPSFVTCARPDLYSSRYLTATAQSQQMDLSDDDIFLPPNRPIHVYAYGPPASMSRDLRTATRGLITTVVNGQDIVPSLSLGVLHDFHAISCSFKHDISDARTRLKAHIWDSVTRSLLAALYHGGPHEGAGAASAGAATSLPPDDTAGLGEDSWAWTTLQGLRSQLTAPKLLPPGEVFAVETMRVLQRDAFGLRPSTSDGYPRLGRPATRVQLKYVRDVEGRFQELRFGSGMLGDHSPARYEAGLAVLANGVLEE